MAKQPKNPQQQLNFQVSAPTQVQTVTTHYQGLVPHPDILRGLDEVVPGTSARLVKLAEEESIHRRELESKTTDANISAQQHQLLIAELQSRAVFRSDLMGQIAGLLAVLPQPLS